MCFPMTLGSLSLASARYGALSQAGLSIEPYGSPPHDPRERHYATSYLASRAIRNREAGAMGYALKLAPALPLREAAMILWAM